MTPETRWALVGLVTSIVALAVKLAAWWLTGSTAILSDALESIVNLVTSGFTLYAVRLAGSPGDADHPYGHGKIEYFSAGLEGALLLAAAASIAVVSVPRLVHPVEISGLGGGAVLQAAISVVLLAAGQSMVRAGRRLRSVSVEADGLHLRADAVTSFGVLAGILAVIATGWLPLDPIIAIAVSASIAWSGARLLRRSVGALMDEADPTQLSRVAETLEDARRPGWLAPHRCRVQRFGAHLHIDLHVVFPRFWPLSRAHDACQEVETAFRDSLGQMTEAMIHAEPCRDESCAHCDVEDCPVRASPFVRRERWTGSAIASPERHAPARRVES